VKQHMNGEPSALGVAELRVHLDERTVALDAQERFDLLAALLEAGHPVTQGGSSAGALAVVSNEPDAHSANTFALSELGRDAIVERVGALRQGTSAPKPGEWTPWFPVIDFARCTNCMQCLSFCLFDVYGVDEQGQITVRNESKCKTSCPACSRVCPEVAILFPKYTKGPINGDVVRQEDVTSESMKVDISALLGGDIYSALKDRSQAAKKRFSTERDESKALLERKRCLKELKDSLDIPDEVLMSLPSAGDIEERARRAKEKALKRRARSQTVEDEKRRTVTEEEWGI